MFGKHHIKSMPDAETCLVVCPHCRTEYKVSGVTLGGLLLWQSGGLIQNIFPGLSSDARELLMSGTCPVCWEQIFPKDE